MTDTPLKACIDRVIPPELTAVAKAKQAAEQEADKPSPFELAVETGKMWKTGRTLRIRFLDGDKALHKRVEAYACDWLRFANLQFDFGNHPKAEIRVSFTRPGYWSALGTDALVEEYFPRTEPTMNFGELSVNTPDEEVARVVLHEFGHALGCIHEHANPSGSIRWNKEVVYRELGGPPNRWNKDTVDRNVFQRYDKTLTQFTSFDPKSIMLYAFPPSWTLDGMTFPTNRTLSETDKKFIASRYPKSS
jgi:hypothetical protein